jgi:hypothetical protein
VVGCFMFHLFQKLFLVSIIIIVQYIIIAFFRVQEFNPVIRTTFVAN